MAVSLCSMNLLKTKKPLIKSTAFFSSVESAGIEPASKKGIKVISTCLENN